MSVKVRMGAAFVLALGTVAILIVTGPEYYGALQAAIAAHSPTHPTAPPLMVASSFMGTAAWLLVVHQQWRQRQFGWVVASFLLSYVAVIGYSAKSLFSLFRPSVTHATA